MDDELVLRPFLEPGSVTIDDFDRLDIRIGRILEASPLKGARKPAYALRIDFGAAGLRGSSAQLARTHPDPAVLVGRPMVAVVNFPERRVAGFGSEVLGALAPNGHIPLLSVDAGAEPGQRVGWARCGAGGLAGVQRGACTHRCLVDSGGSCRNVAQATLSPEHGHTRTS